MKFRKTSMLIFQVSIIVNHFLIFELIDFDYNRTAKLKFWNKKYCKKAGGSIYQVVEKSCRKKSFKIQTVLSKWEEPDWNETFQKKVGRSLWKWLQLKSPWHIKNEEPLAKWNKNCNIFLNRGAESSSCLETECLHLEYLVRWLPPGISCITLFFPKSLNS